MSYSLYDDYSKQVTIEYIDYDFAVKKYTLKNHRMFGHLIKSDTIFDVKGIGELEVLDIQSVPYPDTKELCVYIICSLV